MSVTIAMYCLVQLYIQIKEDLAQHRPFLKVLSIKLVIFLCFWQNLLIEVLTNDKNGPLKPTEFVASPDLRIGIPCLFTCVDMAVFACLHRWAFPWKPYHLKGHQKQPKQYDYAYGPSKALLQAIYPWDYFKAAARGFRWLFHGVRFRMSDPSYQNKASEELGRDWNAVPLPYSMSDSFIGYHSDLFTGGLKKRNTEARNTI